MFCYIINHHHQPVLMHLYPSNKQQLIHNITNSLEVFTVLVYFVFNAQLNKSLRVQQFVTIICQLHHWHIIAFLRNKFTWTSKNWFAQKLTVMWTSEFIRTLSSPSMSESESSADEYIALFVEGSWWVNILTHFMKDVNSANVSRPEN